MEEQGGVFGGAPSWADECSIRKINEKKDKGGTVTKASETERQREGSEIRSMNAALRKDGC